MTILGTRKSGPGRRDFLKLIGAGGVFFAARGAFAQALTETPAQTIGPYYPNRMPLDLDNDLLIINDAISPAVGDITWLSGRILDRRGDPVRGALVEIWQADVNGAYIHTASTIKNRDAGFQGYGKFITGSTGEYVFRTVKPGIYPGRTRHVHYAVTAPGQPRFVTQLYETGLALNNTDGVLQGIRDASQRSSVIVPWTAIEGSQIGEVAAKFDIVLGYTPAEQQASATPKIFSLAGLANAASFIPATSPGARIAIYGAGFATESLQMQASDVGEDGSLPLSLAGVTVTVDGRSAPVLSVSPQEVQVLTPGALAPAASVEVVVSNTAGSSDAATIVVRDAMPSLFLETGGYLRAFRIDDGLRIGPPGLIPDWETVAARPGDILSIYATGLVSVDEPVTIWVHNTMSPGVMPSLAEPGYYALQFTVPNLDDGEYGVAIEASGARTEKAGRLYIRK